MNGVSSGELLRRSIFSLYLEAKRIDLLKSLFAQEAESMNYKVPARSFVALSDIAKNIEWTARNIVENNWHDACCHRDEKFVCTTLCSYQLAKKICEVSKEIKK